jgi:hypothetical protein
MYSKSFVANIMPPKSLIDHRSTSNEDIVLESLLSQALRPVSRISSTRPENVAFSSLEILDEWISIVLMLLRMAASMSRRFLFIAASRAKTSCLDLVLSMESAVY